MTGAAPLRIVIADDHALFRQGLRSMLRLQSEVTVVAEIERAADLAPVLARTPCDVVLLDLQMERSSLRDIGALSTHATVVVVTASERPEDALAAIQAGARGVVFKRFAIETLMDAIRAVAGGDVWTPAVVQTELTTRLRQPPVDPLTPREREIVRLVALGLRNAEVAARLTISEVTVKTHLNNVFQKLNLRDRVELALYAVREGIIEVHDSNG
jgi:two-component system NarL family response regulator